LDFVGLFIYQAFSWASTKLSSHPLVFRVIKGMFFFLVFVILAVLFGVAKLTFVDLFRSALAFLPSGWALIQVILNSEAIYFFKFLHVQ
jgi:apolipoprotein N-acyltransferase